MRKTKRTAGILAIAAAFGVVAATPALGQPADQTEGGWRLEVTPYVWMAGVTGDIHAGPASATIGASFSDILNSLDFGLMGLLQVRKGRVGFSFDGMYTRLTKDGTTSGPVPTSVRAEIVSQLYSFTFSYRVLEGRVPLDIGVGARVMPMSTTLELTSGAFEGAQAAGGNTAVDGFIAARVSVLLAGRWALEGYGDVGAGDSKLSWQALGGLKIGLSGTLSLKLGYRYLSIHNESPDLSTRVGEGGFYLGIGIRL
jgi:opacity protein-like surface antigen